ncbi:MAG: 50S ribosomal protein L7/L12, large subunit ribosomal protein L7/L12 [Microgenomates group bacterium GW2011_GWC1_41_8]|uniref:Large ribosomal subunit protein bL12 n=3 Tax=Candidatus Roizmaniibacteriota TaxID=1752723 RepID=A0A0G0XCG8_9BACT|nr:MAG: 50S ribosomal protein L7/L12 [Candidatus Roizmanbacteria bacterium GW2011_GWB1_40_7]KKR91157.1 MAG: 50S ribosomal protein L7/L12 [Candidatus Roizmanbacteria bacterium GW2011_GWA1_41_13]KKS22604.1 MAG: 50S ribosomal protein L7/L12 [Candidatus Roizmanbacteria bacterium GW2011_GWC2_41_7]KKS23129.1 MAG: 50S ribosomal protein L7/L12, large subunit ribosomal protein L7/L12 [Microgenomates group bacterium GW2011_GWC1_41_8]OGK49335.1 MAG: 50S ribosomal protein L7/L12 [Candidatus Roizmanbacteria
MAENTKKTDVSSKLSKLMDEIEKLSVLELAELVKALEEKFGVATVAAAPVAMAGAPAAVGAPIEEKTSFTVVLKADGGKKIQVLKAVREIKSDLTLLDAKKLVESLPKDLLTNVKKEEAEAVKKKLEEAGGQVELK